MILLVRERMDGSFSAALFSGYRTHGQVLGWARGGCLGGVDCSARGEGKKQRQQHG